MSHHAVKRAAQRVKGVDPQELVANLYGALAQGREDLVERVCDGVVRDTVLYRACSATGQVFGLIVHKPSGTIKTILSGNRHCKTPHGMVRVDGKVKP